MNAPYLTKPLCPGCDSQNLHLHEDRGLHVWMCRHCPTTVHMSHHGFMIAYFIDVKHKGKWYMACFQVHPAPNKPVFSIEYLELHKLEKDRERTWRPLLTLNFLPKMTAKSFAEKLPLLLAFI